jgi:NADPH2:quinone reductase
VVSIGAGVDADLVGRRVLGVSAFTAGHGSFAEYCLASARTVHPVPDGLDAGAAATFFISMHTAWVGLVERAAVTPADRVLVLGAGGGTGLGAVALATALDVEVIAVVGDDARAAACTAAGAATIIDHRHEDVGHAVDAATAGRGVTVVYDPVGGTPGTTAARCLASGGRHLLIGFAAGSWAAPDPALLVRANASLVGVYTGAYDRAASEQHHRALSELVRRGRLPVVCTARLPLSEAPRAVSAVAERRAVGTIALLV